ncbi:MAG: DUF6775 family putative metallopeptidase [Thermoplasmata archaeon]
MTPSRSEFLAVPTQIFLYEEPASPTVDLGELRSYLREITGLQVETRPEFFSYHRVEDPEALATKLAGLKIRDLHREEQDFDPLLGEVNFELNLLQDPRRGLPGILYDGFRFQELMRSLLPREERTLTVLHVALTHRLLATFDPGDKVYHARAIVCGYPSVISTSGVVEGPAKPREFYLAKRGYHALGIPPPTEVLKEEIGDRFIDYDDERMTEVLKGYVLQAVFYHLKGDPFCKDPDCRLFNAHWQEEMIRAQVTSGRLCEEHSRVLTRLP